MLLVLIHKDNVLHLVCNLFRNNHSLHSCLNRHNCNCCNNNHYYSNRTYHVDYLKSYQNSLISFTVSQIKYLRVNFPVFGVTLLIIRYLLLVVQSAALDVQLSAEDTLLPYPWYSSYHFINFKISL